METNERKEGDTFTGECETCFFETNLTVYRRAMSWDGAEKKAICALCASTEVGQINDYSATHSIRENGAVKRQINYVGNVILAAIRKGDTP